MIKFFIDIYESVIEIYNHLDPDVRPQKLSTCDKINKNNDSPSHYIITIQKPYATYDTFAPYSLKQLATEIPQEHHFQSTHSTPTTSTTTTPSTSSSAITITPSRYDDIKLDESTILLNDKVIDDYFIIPETKVNIDEDWEFIANKV